MTVGEGEHPLQCPYAFWFSRRAPGKLQSSTNYADNIKLVGKFASVSLLVLHRVMLDLMVCQSWTSSPSSSPGRGHNFVFLGKTRYSHGASIHEGV